MTESVYKIRCVVVGLLWLLMSQAVRAQGAGDVSRYKAAVRLVQAGDYERAKSDLNAVIQRGSSVSPYAHYYYALAAFRQKNYEQGRLMLKQLTARFPDWNKMDEARYLLGAINLDAGQYKDGLTALAPISDVALQQETSRLKTYALGRITNVAQLKQLNRDFPNDRSVALALIALIQRTSSNRDDLELSDRLTNRFGVPTTAQASASVRPVSPPSATSPAPATPTARTYRPPKPTGTYNIAVLFPFRLDEFSADKRLRNQYVYDLYDGYRMAQAKLAEEGITVNLSAYDLENDADKTRELINSPAFAQTDMVIGPLYVEPNRLVAEYANQNNVLLLNPTATNGDLIAGQPTAFLAQPSVSRQAQAVAELARGLNGSRRVAIYFGMARKDSLLAAAYQAELKRQNYQIVDFQKISATAQATATAMLHPQTPTVSATSVPPPPTSSVSSAPAGITVGHVFLASSNDDDGPRLLDALSRRRLSGPLVATATAFDFYKNSTATFKRRDLYLLYPDYMDDSRPAVTDFRERYLSGRNIIPSVFAAEGYDMLLFFGRQLAKPGGPLRNRAGFRSDTDDYVLSGFNYTQTNDNFVVPIVKYEGGRFIKIN